MTRDEWNRKRCTGRPRGWIDDPEARRVRAKKAGQAAADAHRRRALARVANMHPATAYVLGYRTGYNRAMTRRRQQRAKREE